MAHAAPRWHGTCGSNMVPSTAHGSDCLHTTPIWGHPPPIVHTGPSHGTCGSHMVHVAPMQHKHLPYGTICLLNGVTGLQCSPCGSHSMHAGNRWPHAVPVAPCGAIHDPCTHMAPIWLPYGACSSHTISYIVSGISWPLCDCNDVTGHQKITGIIARKALSKALQLKL
jgi:hypothetical protein